MAIASTRLSIYAFIESYPPMVCTYLCGQIKNYAGGKAAVLAKALKALSSVFLWAAKYTPGSLAARRKSPCPKPRRGSRFFYVGLIQAHCPSSRRSFSHTPSSHRRKKCKAVPVRIVRISRQAHRYAAKSSEMQIQQRYGVSICRCMALALYFGQKNGMAFAMPHSAS